MGAISRIFGVLIFSILSKSWPLYLENERRSWWSQKVVLLHKRIPLDITTSIDRQNCCWRLFSNWVHRASRESPTEGGRLPTDISSFWGTICCMQHCAISKLRYVSSDAVCSVVHMVAYKTLRTLENSDKTVFQKGGRGRWQEVAIYERFQL